MKSIYFRLLAILLFSFPLFAQTDDSKFNFYARGGYRENVPRPGQILHYEVGTHHTTYAQMEKVIEEIAKAAPDRVKIFDLGLTSEYRMQHLVAISSPENMARLDEIKANITKLTDPRKTSNSEATSIIQNTPMIAWMAYTIHGNESASFEAMMQVIYQLAASNEPTTLDILKNNVVLVVTGENPDGHERFATWYNSVAVGDPNRSAMEHREPWSIFGRYNHYRFDLNRDNAVATQVETRNMQKAFFEWNPQVAVDHHGQPSQFFFPPVALPINPNFPQPVSNKWMDIYGRANAAAFDANRWDYYNRDIFDLFYIGYWDSMPTLNGAVGMTYETDGGGFKGLNWIRDDGTIVTFKSAIAKHFVASMTTLETSAKHRIDRLKDFYDFRVTAINEAKTEKMKRIVIIPNDPVKTAELIEHLLRFKVEVKLANSAFTSTKAHAFEKDSRVSTKECKGVCFVIDLDQPQKRLIKAFLEPDTPQDKAFVEDNMARFRRNEMRGKSQLKEEYGFYDITAWSLPLAFGLDAFWTEDLTPISASEVHQGTITQYRSGYVSAQASIAYLIPYDSDGAGVMALRLLQEGFRVGVATRKMNAGGINWNAGTFVIRISRNREGIHEAINRLANEYGVSVQAINSGYSEEGDTPIGGEAIWQMRSGLKIAMVGDEGVEQTSYGSIWWMLDRHRIKFTPMTLNNIKSGGLKDYHVLIMPDGAPGQYLSTLGKGGVDSLKEWVSNGGTLITVKGASVLTTLKDVELTTSTMVGSDEDEEKGKTTEEEKPKGETNGAEYKTDKQDWKPAELPPIVSPSSNKGQVPEALPGAIMRATVDRTTWLNYGVNSSEIPVLLSSNYFFRYSKEGTNALLFEANPKRPLTMSGFVWEGNTERLLQGTTYLIDEPTGSGHVILFADEPFFRGIFRSTTKQFFNAIAFNGTF